MDLNFFRKRLPEKNEVFTVLGIVVFVVYSWSIWGFLREVPSFLLFFKLGQILAIFLYMMGFALLECLLVMIGLGLMSLVMPVRWFKDGFVYKSFITVVLGAVVILSFGNTLMSLNNDFPPLELILKSVSIAIAACALLLTLFHYVKPLQKAVLFIADRIGVMAYFYIPLGVLGMIVVLIRNLL
jgi:hypothetical protein